MARRVLLTLSLTVALAWPAFAQEVNVPVTGDRIQPETPETPPGAAQPEQADPEQIEPAPAEPAPEASQSEGSAADEVPAEPAADPEGPGQDGAGPSAAPAGATAATMGELPITVRNVTRVELEEGTAIVDPTGREVATVSKTAGNTIILTDGKHDYHVPITQFYAYDEGSGDRYAIRVRLTDIKPAPRD